MTYLQHLTLNVNNEEQSLVVDTRTSLLDLLRDTLGLTGTKKGCDQGQCGVCTVLIDGRRANACLALAVAHDGSRIVTIEGIGEGDACHPLQDAFVRHDALQCGYCTPGQVMSAIGMLDEIRRGVPSTVTLAESDKSQFSDEDIRERMSGNLCRCGAYSNMLPAILELIR